MTIMQDPDDQKKPLSKKRELNLQPLNSKDSDYWSSDPDELKKLSDRVAQLAGSVDDTPEEVKALVLPPQQTVEPYASEPAELAAPSKKHNMAAVNIVRSKLEKLYAHEPDADEEAIEAYQAGKKRTKHQQFMLDLTNSGKSLAAIQVEWHAYYAALPDDQKHEVWQEFYAAHSAPQNHTPQPAETPAPTEQRRRYRTTALESPQKNDTRTVSDIKKQITRHVTGSGLKAKHHVQSLLFGLGMASMVVVLLLFSFFNERFIAPFISPSRTVSATPIVGSITSVSLDPKIIIPKINLEVPVIFGLDTSDEATVQKNLENGVVHYSTTAQPGQTGNVVVVGHSSNNILNKGKYKFAFVLLKRLEIGDTFSMDKDGTRYTYQIYDKKIVKPTDVSILGTAAKPNSATLITCDPPGTSINRLVVIGEQISPDPAGNKSVDAPAPTLTSKGILPGNSPSLWQRITHLF